MEERKYGGANLDGACHVVKSNLLQVGQDATVDGVAGNGNVDTVEGAWGQAPTQSVT